jgi:hypothetical protein
MVTCADKREAVGHLRSAFEASALSIQADRQTLPSGSQRHLRMLGH